MCPGMSMAVEEMKRCCPSLQNTGTGLIHNPNAKFVADRSAGAVVAQEINTNEGGDSKERGPCVGEVVRCVGVSKARDVKDPCRGWEKEQDSKAIATLR